MKMVYNNILYIIMFSAIMIIIYNDRGHVIILIPYFIYLPFYFANQSNLQDK